MRRPLRRASVWWQEICLHRIERKILPKSRPFLHNLNVARTQPTALKACFLSIAMSIFKSILFSLIWIANYVSYAQVCLCDTSQACDLLCCCDLDCSENDRETFTCETTDTTSSQADVTCISHSIFSKITPDSSFSFLRVNDDNCFTSTEPTISSSSVKTARAESSDIESHSTPLTFTSSFNDISSQNGTILKANDLIYVLEGVISQPLLLPAGFRGNCVQDSVLFLKNSSSSCSVKITEANCQAGSKIDSSTYSNLNLLKNYRMSNETISVVTECENQNGTKFEDCRSPSKNDADATCENGVTDITLVVSYGKETVDGNVSLGILSAKLTMKLKTVQIGSSSSLSTAVTFNGNSQDYPNVSPRYQRYRSGYDLLFNVSGTKQNFAPFNADSDCTNNPLTYPHSSILHCSKTITEFSTTDFTALTQKLFNPLPSALAKYYNSDLEKSLEWFQLSWNIPEKIENTAVPMNLILTIKHHSYGNKLNPENEIVSASTSVVTTDLSYLNKEGLIKDKLVFYFTLQFVNLDVDSSKENNIISKLSRSLSNYFSYQRDSVPLQFFAIAVLVFLFLTSAILVNDLGKPQF